MRKRFLFMPLFGLLVVAAFSTIVILLWNFTIPAIFGLTAINFWQALALFVLTRILFGNFPGRGGMPFQRGRNPFQERWTKMSPEERKEFVGRRRKSGFGMPFARPPFGGPSFAREDDFNMSPTEAPSKDEQTKRAGKAD